MRITFRALDSKAKNIVERKGAGHPDTLADLIADKFSYEYTRHGIRAFGGLLNHNVDKLVLCGGVAELSFGCASVIKPIECILYGKLTSGVGGDIIEVESLFALVVKTVFDSIFGEGTFHANRIHTRVATNCGIGAEHRGSYYSPGSPEELEQISDTLEFTDTSVCAAFCGLSDVEQLCLDVEHYLNGAAFKFANADTGYDVKVMLAESDDVLDITVCIPFLASKVISFEHYLTRLGEIKCSLHDFISGKINVEFSLALNTKDRPNSGYLTVFGTALDKGDFGAVGRGNRQEGIISLNRPNVVEAPCGKNLFRSTAKICQTSASLTAQMILRQFGVPSEVAILGQNGRQLRDASITVAIPSHALDLGPKIACEMEALLSSHASIVKHLLSADPLIDRVGYCLKPLI